LEDLNIKGMVKNHKLSKHIYDASWSKFVELLTYKSKWNEKQIVKIDRFFPSSKTCNCCGYINQNLDLSVREWTCPSCNTKLDRDLNASINILKEGYKLISSGTDDYRRGDKIRPTSVGTIGEASKILNIYISEAHPIAFGVGG
jgi:putative transposase